MSHIHSKLIHQRSACLLGGQHKQIYSFSVPPRVARTFGLGLLNEQTTD